MKKYGLIGDNIQYSLSPIIFNYLFKKYNIDAQYDLLDTNCLDRVDYNSYDGLNITKPYKEVAYNNVEKLGDNLQYKSINCIYKNTGYNFDLPAFEYLAYKLLTEDLSDIHKITILGNGAMAKMITKFFTDKNILVKTIYYKDTDYEVNDYTDVLINTTPCGQGKLYNKLPLKESEIIKFKYVIDLNYSPNINPMLIICKKNHIPCINGLYMLIYQAILTFNLWFNDIVVDKDALIKELIDEISSTQFRGQVYIGMPFSGKTTLINQFNDGVDLDSYIEKHEGKTINSIISNYGIEYFRHLETKYLTKIVAQNVKYIALGGGTVLDFNNLYILRDYEIIFLDVDIETICSRNDGSRILFKNNQNLIQTYSQRISIYKSWETHKDGLYK